MPSDLLLTEAHLGIPAGVVGKLKDLAIRGVRQLHARLRREGPGLQDYLQLSDPAFADLCRKVEGAISDHYPEDLQPHVHPEVNKKGVAVHRLHDPKRPRRDPPKEG
jgi:hypothetical protein